MLRQQIYFLTWYFIKVSPSASVSAISRRIIIHGSQLTLDLPERTQRLKFVSADESDKFTIWEHKSSSLSPSKPSKGQVSSASNGWTFRIQHVTFDDQGTYTLLNQSGSTIASYILKNNISVTVHISSLSQSDATLRFYSNYSSITLVENGVPVGRNHTDYINRLKVTSESIKVLNVSASDKGKYRLTDPKGRLVSLKAMILVDQHKFAPNKRLIALLLLVIPVGICFCCRKRICKSCQTTKSNTHTNESNTTPVSIAYSNTVTAPVGPGDPGQGFHPESVPQNPVYPPNFGPGLPPAQPPQWNAPPTQYNPSAPVVHLKSFANVFAFHPACLNFYVLICNTKIASKCNYMPAKNSAPPGPDTTGLNMNELPPTAPLLTPQLESQPSAMSSISMMNMLKSSDSGVQFDNNKGKSSGSNFL
uniref:Wu:fc21g02 n=1 Tax=Cyprinus carpio TaxID=7962 RepID=A0A8C2KSJ1_CYPCA